MRVLRDLSEHRRGGPEPRCRLRTSANAEVVALHPDCGLHLRQESGNVELSGAVDARIPHALQARIDQGGDAECERVRNRRAEETGPPDFDRLTLSAFMRPNVALPCSHTIPLNPVHSIV